MFKSVIVCTLSLSLAACSSDGADPTRELHQIFEDEWAFRLQEDPLFATSVGVHDFNDRLPEVNEEAEQRRTDFLEQLLARLDAIDPSRLAFKDQINLDIFRIQLDSRIASSRYRSHLIPILADRGFHTRFARLAENVPLATVRDYENYIARMQAFPGYVGEHIELMREGLRTGFTQPQVILEGYEVSIQSQIVENPQESVFYAPFQHFPTAVPKDQYERLRDSGKQAIRESIVPAYAEFLAFMVNEYRPGARTTLGASEFPDGCEYYAYLIHHFTTLDLTADQVHEIGLKEVARIRKEMDEVIREVGFEGDFAAFLQFLRTDPRFYPKTPEQLLKEASYIAKKMDGKLPALFKTLPRLPYGVEPVPAAIAPKYTAGRYVGAPMGSTRPGYYWVNTHSLGSRTLYTLEALTLHEAVPGHHLQNALRQELTELPEFRRFSGFNAFGEGWGLYSERLGLEAGFYTDPYSNFGRLTYEMWRACRLVVDTGLHARGWTRQEAMDYLASNTALSLHEIRTETDRYISWPGQALAYKMGELKIRQLREKAEKALGERFDVREFHDAVLLNGSIPLSVLEDQIDLFIRRVPSE